MPCPVKTGGGLSVGVQTGRGRSSAIRAPWAAAPAAREGPQTGIEEADLSAHRELIDEGPITRDGAPAGVVLKQDRLDSRGDPGRVGRVHNGTGPGAPHDRGVRLAIPEQ